MRRVAEDGIVVELFSSDGSRSPTEAWRGDWIRRTMLWLRSIRDYCVDFSDSSIDLVDAVQSDLLGKSRVFVFTPKGMIVDLPQGSTVVDLAYKIHSAIGTKMIGANVNGKIVDNDYVLQNADLVNIMTSIHSLGPSREWLDYAKTRTARLKIRHFLKAREKSERVEAGKALLDRHARESGAPSPSEAALLEILPLIARLKASKGYDFDTVEDLFLFVADSQGRDETRIETVIMDTLRERRSEVFRNSTMSEEYDLESSASAMDLPRGTDRRRIYLCRRCRPVRGDQVMGCRLESGIRVHRIHCGFLLKSLRDEPSKCIPVSWSRAEERMADSVAPLCSPKAPAAVEIRARDSTGLLCSVAGQLSDLGISITASATSTDEHGIATLKFEILVSDKADVQRAMETLKQRDDVIGVTRAGIGFHKSIDMEISDAMTDCDGGFEVTPDEISVGGHSVNDDMFDEEEDL